MAEQLRRVKADDSTCLVRGQKETSQETAQPSARSSCSAQGGSEGPHDTQQQGRLAGSPGVLASPTSFLKKNPKASLHSLPQHSALHTQAIPTSLSTPPLPAPALPHGLSQKISLMGAVGVLVPPSSSNAAQCVSAVPMCHWPRPPRNHPSPHGATYHLKAQLLVAAEIF